MNSWKLELQKSVSRESRPHHIFFVNTLVTDLWFLWNFPPPQSPLTIFQWSSWAHVCHTAGWTLFLLSLPAICNSRQYNIPSGSPGIPPCVISVIYQLYKTLYWLRYASVVQEFLVKDLWILRDHIYFQTFRNG